MRRLLALVLPLALALTACTSPARQEVPQEGGYSVYFPVGEDGTAQVPTRWSGGSGGADSAALGREPAVLPDGEDWGVDGLLECLLAGPRSAALTSPFPSELTVRSWQLEEGTVWVDLSEAYGGLSGVELTLADSCIVLTLCQLEEVEAVYLTVEGRPRPFRDQILSPDDLQLDNHLDPAQG